MKDHWNRTDADGVKHPRQGAYSTGIGQLSDGERDLYKKAVAKTLAAMRVCLKCGALAVCDPARPCASCGASHFHLIPPARDLADW